MGKSATGMMLFFFIWLFGHPALALTGEQVLALKKAGVGDETIQLMLQQETAARENPRDNAGVREIKDKEGHTVIIYSTGAKPREPDEAERKKLEKAWQMLPHLIIDGRK